MCPRRVSRRVPSDWPNVCTRKTNRIWRYTARRPSCHGEQHCRGTARSKQYAFYNINSRVCAVRPFITHLEKKKRKKNKGLCENLVIGALLDCCKTRKRSPFFFFFFKEYLPKSNKMTTFSANSFELCTGRFFPVSKKLFVFIQHIYTYNNNSLGTSTYSSSKRNHKTIHR